MHMDAQKDAGERCLLTAPRGLDSVIPSERCDGIIDFATKFLLRPAHPGADLVGQENKLILLKEFN